MWSVPQPAQARLAACDEVVAREAGVVGPVPHRQARLGGEQHAVAPAAQRLADDLLRHAVGVDVGGVDQVDAGVEAQVDLARGAGDVGHPDRRVRAPAAEGHRAERQRRDAQAGAAELAVLHSQPPTVRTTLPVTRRSRRASSASRVWLQSRVSLAVHAQPPVGDQRREHAEVRAERLLAGGVDEEADQAPERRLAGEVVERQRRRLAPAGDAVGDDRAAPAQAVDRVAQHGPPHPVEHGVEAAGVVVERA